MRRMHRLQVIVPTIRDTDELVTLRAALAGAQAEESALRGEAARLQATYRAAVGARDFVTQSQTSGQVGDLPARLAAVRCRCLDLGKRIAEAEVLLWEPLRATARQEQTNAEEQIEAAKAERLRAIQVASRIDYRLGSLRDTIRRAEQTSAEIAAEATSQLDRDAKRLLSVA